MYAAIACFGLSIEAIGVGLFAVSLSVKYIIIAEKKYIHWRQFSFSAVV